MGGKNFIVVATAPDGEIIGYGPMTHSDAGRLTEEINAHEGWSATVPIFGSVGMWPSSFEAKTGETFEPRTRGYQVHLHKEA